VTTMAYTPDFQVAWSSCKAEDKTFFSIVRKSLLAFLIMALAMPWLPVPEILREEKVKEQPQLATVVIQKKELPKPVLKPLSKPKPKVVKAKPKPKPKVKPKKKVAPKPVDLVKKARENASVAGVLAFQDDLAAMRDAIQIDRVARSDLTRGSAKAEKFERKVISSNIKSSSGGINTATLSADTGGIALSGHTTTKIQSVPPGSGGLSVKAEKPNASKIGGRSDEAIRRIMDVNKGAIFSIYNRALRKDPSLQGRFVFELTIEPSGTVSSIKLLSSELNNDSLARKILSRIRMIRFGAEEVLKTRVNYSFDFLPY